MSEGLDLSPSRRKNVLIVGAGFHNEGAYMMLVAAARFIRERLGAQPLVELQYGTAQQKRWVGLDSLLAVQKLHFRPWGMSDPRVEKLSRHLPFRLGVDVDAVLDASGFSYSDQWRHVPIARQANELARWAERGVPVFLLPQALGPFEHTAEVARVVIGAARRVFARDPGSYDYAREKAPVERRDDVLLFPDFTIGLQPTVPSNSPALAPLEGGLAIVPNWNIVARSSTTESRDQYLESLVGAVDAARERDIPVFGLGHEGGRDLEILHRLRSRVHTLDIVSGLNGLESKWLLGKVGGLVGGRFHALVSALSSGTPALLHGWSHKYTWLAQDFGVEDQVLDPYIGRSGTSARVGMLLDRGDAMRDRLVSTARVQAERVAEMWNLVERELQAAWASEE